MTRKYFDRPKNFITETEYLFSKDFSGISNHAINVNQWKSPFSRFTSIQCSMTPSKFEALFVDSQLPNWQGQ